jgi:hypothetical protein
LPVLSLGVHFLGFDTLFVVKHKAMLTIRGSIRHPLGVFLFWALTSYIAAYLTFYIGADRAVWSLAWHLSFLCSAIALAGTGMPILGRIRARAIGRAFVSALAALIASICAILMWLAIAFHYDRNIAIYGIAVVYVAFYGAIVGAALGAFFRPNR